MIRTWHRRAGEFAPVGGSAPESTPDWEWIDVLLDDTDEVRNLAQRFGWSELSVEDAISDTHYPRVDLLGDHAFVVLHGFDEEDGRVVTSEIDAFLGAGYLVTIHRSPSPSIEWLADVCTSDPAYTQDGPDVLLATVAETIGRRYMPLLDAIDDRIATLETAAIAGESAVPGEVQALRRDIIVLRRTTGPQREVLLTLSRPTSSLVGHTAQLRFDSVYDHFYRLVEDLDSARSLLASVLDTYRSSIAERANEIMKVLTVYAAIILPLSLLAGIYGMNFLNMPELSWKWGYFGLLGLMALLAIGQWVYFARRGFIGPPPTRTLGKGLASLSRLPISSTRVNSERKRGDSS